MLIKTEFKNANSVIYCARHNAFELEDDGKNINVYKTKIAGLYEYDFGYKKEYGIFTGGLPSYNGLTLDNCYGLSKNLSDIKSIDVADKEEQGIKKLYVETRKIGVEWEKNINRKINIARTGLMINFKNRNLAFSKFKNKIEEKNDYIFSKLNILEFSTTEEMIDFLLEIKQKKGKING